MLVSRLLFVIPPEVYYGMCQGLRFWCACAGGAASQGFSRALLHCHLPPERRDVKKHACKHTHVRMYVHLNSTPIRLYYANKWSLKNFV